MSQFFGLLAYQNQKMRVFLVVFLFAICPKQFAQAVFHAWCNLKEFGCGKTLNSMCLYDERPFKYQCLNMVDGVAEEIWILKYWLALVNSFRDQVAGGNFQNWPKAANMKQLVWDNMLEAQARRWNFQCFLERADDCNRNFNYNNTQIGQMQSYIRNVKKQMFVPQMNELFVSVVNKGKKIRNVTDLIDKGISEELIRRGGPRSVLPSVLFANSEYVGASLVVSGWESVEKPNIMRSNTYTAPISYGSAVYQQGSPCSKCPKGWSCSSRGSYPNLCAKSSYPKYEQRIDINFALSRRFQKCCSMPVLAAMVTFTSIKTF